MHRYTYIRKEKERRNGRIKKRKRIMAPKSKYYYNTILLYIVIIFSTGTHINS